MPVRFRLLAADGAVLDDGEGSVELAGGALVVSPHLGQVLRIRPAEIVDIAEPEPYVVHLTLADGPVLELSRLGAMRTQLLADLGDARAADLPDGLLLDGVGHPETFPGVVGDTPARLLLYDDALVVVPERGDVAKVPYPFVRGVSTDVSGYRISVDVAGQPALTLHGLASRTSEFVELLGERYRAAAGRTAAFLGALLPGLGALGLRTVAGSLRNGLAAPRADLDRVDGSVWPALATATTLPDRADSRRALEELGTAWIGFKQMVSVERAAHGVEAWRDRAITPDLGDHGSPGSAFGSWYLGFAGPFQEMGPWLAYRMLGTGNQHRIVPRADVQRGRLVAAHADLDALTAGGDAPTVLAFVLCRTPTGRIVYEALNDAGQDTYVFRGTDAPALNHALDLVGFDLGGVGDDTGPAGSRYRAAAQRLPALRELRAAYVGRARHTDDWGNQLARLLAP